jgi:hypothetical protein
VTSFAFFSFPAKINIGDCHLLTIKCTHLADVSLQFDGFGSPDVFWSSDVSWVSDISWSPVVSCPSDDSWQPDNYWSHDILLVA